MLQRNLVPAVVIALGLLLLVSTACGIITAPFSVPAAIAANQNMELSGTVTDAAGIPLQGVTLTVQKGHTYWDAAMGQRTDFEDSSALVSEKFSVSRRGSTHVRLIFSKPGYVPALIEFDNHSLYLTAAATTQPNASDAQRVPDTRPDYVYRGNWMGPQGMTNPNSLYVDPSWHPGQKVRIILYPTPPATSATSP